MPERSTRSDNRRAMPFSSLIADYGITCSMSRSGNVWQQVFSGALFCETEIGFNEINHLVTAILLYILLYMTSC